MRQRADETRLLARSLSFNEGVSCAREVRWDPSQQTDGRRHIELLLHLETVALYGTFWHKQLAYHSVTESSQLVKVHIGLEVATDNTPMRARETNPKWKELVRRHRIGDVPACLPQSMHGFCYLRTNWRMRWRPPSKRTRDHAPRIMSTFFLVFSSCGSCHC